MAEFNDVLIKTLNDDPVGYLPPEFAADLRQAASLYSKAETDALLDTKADTTYVDNGFASINLDLASKAPIASPVFTGTPTAPTPATGVENAAIATTAYVVNKIASIYTAADVLSKLLTVDGPGSNLDADKLGGVASASYALLASPAFTGNPTAPNQSSGDISTRIANTQHVTDKVNLAFAVNFTPAEILTKIKTVDGTGSGLDADLWRGLTPAAFVTPGDLSSYALLASPSFTGTPVAPTATPGTNTTQIATTAFVVASFAPLSSPAFSGNPTAPTQTAGDNSTRLATTAFVAASFAPIASPALTGTPTAPTQSTADNSTRLATTAFVVNKIASLNLNDASNLTTGTLPDARLTGAYTGITTLSQSGLHTITTGGEAIRLEAGNATSDPYMTFYKDGVRQAYFQSTDGAGAADGMKVVNDVATGGDTQWTLRNTGGVDGFGYRVNGTDYTVWHTGNLVSSDINALYGYTPLNPSRNLTAGNGLTGGGNLTADRTFTLGTPGTTSGSSTNSVSATSHTHALSLVSGDITDALGFTPPTNNRNLTAGNGLTGGGNLTADRTFTLGTPSSITNSTTNSVTTTSHTHALGFTAAEVYTGTSSTNTDYPVGTPLIIVGTEVNRSASTTMDYSTSNSTDFVASGGTSLSGTWRGRGRTASGNTLVQRTA